MPTATGTYATRAGVTSRVGGTFDSSENTLIDTLCNQINAWIEQTVGRVLAPRTETEVILDGYMAELDGRVMPLPFGLNSLTSLEVGLYTGADFYTVPSTDWFLMPRAILRRQGWPATAIYLTDIPSSGNQVGRIPHGLGNVRLRGASGFTGWPAIPDEISELATNAVVRAWHARQVGQSEVVDEQGRPIVMHYLSRNERDILRKYDLHPRAGGGDRLIAAN